MATWDARQAATPGPLVSTETVRNYAADHGVCVRPLLRWMTDREHGAVVELTIPCGSTREAACPPCVDKARRLRIQQCAEGWHLTDDQLTHPGAKDHPETLGHEKDVENDDEGGAAVGSRR